MLFTCPRCQTVYDVPESKAKTVHKMRCASCSHVWAVQTDSPESKKNDNPLPDSEEEQSLPPAESDPAVEEPVSEENENISEEPQEEEDVQFDFNASVTPDKKEKEIDISAFKDVFKEPEKEEKPAYLVWVRPLYLLGIACLFGAIYLLFFHKIPSIPLTFQAVSYEFMEQDYRRFLIMHASLHNESDEFAKLDSFKIRFFDAMNRKILDMDVPSPLSVVPAGKTGAFDLRVERPPANAMKVEILLEKVQLSKTPFPAQSKTPAVQETPNTNPSGRGTENRSPEESMPVYPKSSSLEPGQIQETNSGETAVNFTSAAATELPTAAL